MVSRSFFNRDISWLSFNQCVLAEAGKEAVPLMERIRFLSIYSSNLDEFYRVRMPTIMALQKIEKVKDNSGVYSQATEIINKQQNQYGEILNHSIIPALKKQGLNLIYNEQIPAGLLTAAEDYFFTQVAGFLQPKRLSPNDDYFPKNNQLYILAIVQFQAGDEEMFLINIPSGDVSRFFKIKTNETYILFLEDIIKLNLHRLFPAAVSIAAYNIKITRDAEMNLEDEYDTNLLKKIEKQLAKRDFGLATRFLYQPGIPLRNLQAVIQGLNLSKASAVEGGTYHNLKDLAQLPVDRSIDSYPEWPALPSFENEFNGRTLLARIIEEDRMIHTPYQSYGPVLRFFNEAAIDNTVEEIYTTLYRVASDSKIVNALISAAKNGKKVVVMVELKARFDEANNIKWAKKMKSAGVRILYSNNTIKVHAKIALIKRNDPQAPYIGLLATGNLNENTARFYTDHILLTAHQPLLAEMDELFTFLKKRKKPETENVISFKHLLIAQFNLHARFLELIDREIAYAKQGIPAGITIKLNNLEEEVLIGKLYEASDAGVKIKLIVRSVCRLVPGVPGQSGNITVKRIVDRYLEHGRVFIFDNNGDPDIFMGSADWMNRNIYRRIEVCFPVYAPRIKEQLAQLLALQWSDNVQAISIDHALSNLPVKSEPPVVRSQEAVYNFLSKIYKPVT